MAPLPQLLCFPPAGTGPSLFYPWTLKHADRVSIHPVPLPGRETRIAEALPQSIGALAGRLATELAPRLTRRYAMFGYSMGAVLAYEVARLSAHRGLPGPEAFFILACNPPDRLLEGRTPLHVLDSAAFWQAITDLGGTPKEVLDTPEALTLFEPIVRNDFRICETYQHRADGWRLPCPIHAFVADRDGMVDAGTAAGWADFVGDHFTLHELTGNHMLERDAFTALLGRILALWEDATAYGAAANPTLAV